MHGMYYEVNPLREDRKGSRYVNGHLEKVTIRPFDGPVVELPAISTYLTGNVAGQVCFVEVAFDPADFDQLCTGQSVRLEIEGSNESRSVRHVIERGFIDVMSRKSTVDELVRGIIVVTEIGRGPR